MFVAAITNVQVNESHPSKKSHLGQHSKNGLLVNRDVSADILRIVACLVVIGNHCAYPASNDCSNAFSRTFVSTLYSDGVSYFFFLAGFFSFYPKEKPYSVHIKYLLTRIVLPLFTTLFFYILFGAYAKGEATLLQSISDGLHNLNLLALSAFFWDNKCPYSGHLWYLFVYSFLMLWYPFIAASIRYILDSHKEKQYLIAISALLFLNDLTRNRLLAFASHTQCGASIAFLFIVAGCIFWQHRDIFRSRLFLIASPILFIIVNLIRASIQIHRWNMGIDDITILYYYTTFSLICTFLIASFCFSLSTIFSFARFSHCISKIGALTFPVYLVHLMIRSYMLSRGLFGKVSAWLSISDSSGALSLFIYTTICELLVFSISLAISALLSRVISVLKPS